MTLSNHTPAERIVVHETKIADNIQQIQTNEQLINTQETEYKVLLSEQKDLATQSPTWPERLTLNSRLKDEKTAKAEEIKDAIDETSALKEDTYELKQDTYSEQEKLKVAHADQDALNQQNIQALEKSKNSTEDRLERLESYNEDDPEKAAKQAESIGRVQAVLAKRENALAEAKESSQLAKEAAQARDDKVANDIKEACPLKCTATKLAIKSNNPNRAYQLATEINGGIQTLHVISLSQEGVKKAGGNQKGKTPPVSIISVALTGKCEKGKGDSSPESSNHKKLERISNNEFCPIVKIQKSPINIAMPAIDTKPLDFQAFCKSPPSGLLNWGYLFKNILMPSKREPNIYTLQTEGCDGRYTIASQVAAYPKVKAELGVAISYKPTKEFVPYPSCGEYPETSEVKTDFVKSTRTVEHGNWVYNLSLKGSVDTINLESQLEHLSPNDLFKKVREALDIFFFVFDIIKLCCNEGLGSNIFKDDEAPKTTEGKLISDKAPTSPTGNIDLNYPKIAFGIAYENCEEMGKNSLGHASALSLKLDPLIGVNCKVDMLSALIKIGANGLLPGSAAAAEKFHKYAWPLIQSLMSDKEQTASDIEKREYFLEAGIALVLTIGANITAEAKWTHTNPAINLSKNPAPLPDSPDNYPKSSAFEGLAGASLDIYLEGKVYVKGKAWAVHFEAGLIVALGSAQEVGAAKLQLEIKIAGENGSPKIDGVFKWNGLAIMRASYKSAGIGSKDNDIEEKVDVVGRPGAVPINMPTNETKEAISTKNLKNKWVLIEHGQSPKASEPVPINDYFNT